MHMMENGKMINVKVGEFTLVNMVHDMMEMYFGKLNFSGKMIYNMDLVENLGQMVTNMKELIVVVRKMEKDQPFFLMELNMMEIS